MKPNIYILEITYVSTPSNSLKKSLQGWLKPKDRTVFHSKLSVEIFIDKLMDAIHQKEGIYTTCRALEVFRFNPNSKEKDYLIDIKYFGVLRFIEGKISRE